MSFPQCKSPLRQALACAALLLLASCTSVGLAALNLPSRFGSGTIIQDMNYGPQPWEKLDIFVPTHAGDRKLDVVVFFYGGRWEEGAKNDYRFVGTAFSDRGFITVIPDY